MSRARLGIVVTHPIQYQVPLFRYLAARSSVEPLVFFLSEHGLASLSIRDSGKWSSTMCRCSVDTSTE